MIVYYDEIKEKVLRGNFPQSHQHVIDSFPTNRLLAKNIQIWLSKILTTFNNTPKMKYNIKSATISYQQAIEKSHALVLMNVNNIKKEIHQLRVEHLKEKLKEIKYTYPEELI